MEAKKNLGYDDAIIPGGKWHVHDGAAHSLG